MGKIISIVNQKGGVGKTTTAVNLASAVGVAGKKVLLIDLDPQGNTTSAYGIAKNTKKFIEQYGEENLTSSMHYLIRSRGACFESTKKAVELAVKTNANLHVLHLSTKEELELFKPFAKQPISQRRISAEVCAHHLFFNNSYCLGC